MKTVYTVYELHDALLLSRPSSFTVRNFLLALLQIQDYVLSWEGLGGMNLSIDCISNQSAAEAWALMCSQGRLDLRILKANALFDDKTGSELSYGAPF